MSPMPSFQLKSGYQPCGDQPEAIEKLVKNLKAGTKEQVLLGVTGSGKTFTMANVIAQIQRPTLVMAPNKTLAAQLYMEFKEFFPDNAVEYFVSYYDYYQPEAYLPRTDVYIEKDSSINDDIDKMRHSATRALLDRNDVIVVASVSCIYGLGSPEAYQGMFIDLQKGMNISRKEIVKRLVEIQYERNDLDFHRGTFRLRGDILDIFPAYEEDRAIRIEFFDDEIDTVSFIDALKGNVLEKMERLHLYPASHYVAKEEDRKTALKKIQKELETRLQFFKNQNRVLEYERLKQRTNYDLEMIEEIGFCSGIENYSRFFDGREPGEPPPTLLQYFPKEFLLFIDESHISVPQIGGMFRGDRARKETLVEYGFRLPSALDNRPLKFEEFENCLDQVIYVSATPGDNELQKAKGAIAEQVVRPTGLLDPIVEVRPAKNQVDDLLAKIHNRVAKNERVLVTTLTKRMSENLNKYFLELGIKSCYLHSDIETIERFQILRDLRKGTYDVLVGIKLLREGLDLREVSLVAILDGDKEGFLRSERSLIQTFGRAARNANGKVLVYADHMTGSLKRAMTETKRRRKLQEVYNKKHGITPKTITKNIPDGLYHVSESDYIDIGAYGLSAVASAKEDHSPIDVKEIPKLLKKFRKEMNEAAKNLEFEKAAFLRDQIKELRNVEMALGES